LVLYNSKRPHKSLELMTPVDYILRESKNCNMWWTHTAGCFLPLFNGILPALDSKIVDNCNISLN
ncbi:hypothetical protein QA652_23645, partial [Klebsiella pneumoniae]|nr:hypothetical protein [Klebsiella pneumoniae]